MLKIVGIGGFQMKDKFYLCSLNAAMKHCKGYHYANVYVSTAFGLIYEESSLRKYISTDEDRVILLTDIDAEMHTMLTLCAKTFRIIDNRSNFNWNPDTFQWKVL